MRNPSPEPNFLHRLACGVLARQLGYGMYRRYVVGLGLTGSERVLEIGQGSGALSRFLAPRCVQLLCVDLSSVWLTTARRKLRRFKNIEYMLGDVTKLPLANQSFDAVVVHFMLHDVEAEIREAVVHTLARVLKPDGKFFVREPIKPGHGLPVAEIRRLLTGAGLSEISGAPGRMPFMGETWSAVWVKGE
jgi:ubiquinone/menaquinone biosynthesis C-methylase UbiE